MSHGASCKACTRHTNAERMSTPKNLGTNQKCSKVIWPINDCEINLLDKNHVFIADAHILWNEINVEAYALICGCGGIHLSSLFEVESRRIWRVNSRSRLPILFLIKSLSEWRNALQSFSARDACQWVSVCVHKTHRRRHNVDIVSLSANRSGAVRRWATPAKRASYNFQFNCSLKGSDGE